MWPCTFSKNHFYKSVLEYFARIQAGDNLAGKDFCEKDLEVLADTFSTSQKYALATEASRLREVNIPPEHLLWNHWGWAETSADHLVQPLLRAESPGTNGLGHIQFSFDTQGWKLYKLFEQTAPSLFKHWKRRRKKKFFTIKHFFNSKTTSRIPLPVLGTPMQENYQ